MNNMAFEAGRSVVVAAGRIHNNAGTPEWAGAHPGFADAITDGGAGNYTVTLNELLAAASYTVQATSETAAVLAAVIRASGPPSTINVRLHGHAGGASDTDVGLAVLAI